jgi:predicted enzyme related to lactoylglutathione lyase
MDRLVNIDVDGLDRAIEFYTSAFDFQVARRFGTDAVELVGGSSPIYLLNKAAGTAATASAAPLREYQRHWTPVHLDIVVADLEASVGRALAAGATQEKPVHISKWGRLALMADPFGQASDCNDPPTAPLTWAQRLKRVFEIDITLCPLCGGLLCVNCRLIAAQSAKQFATRIADVTDPDVIRKILDHVNSRAPPRLPPQRAESHQTTPDLFAER